MNEIFGKMPDGRDVERVHLAKDGLRASIITRGAALQDLRLDGYDHPLVLGFERLEDYITNGGYFGANVGRFANRLAGGQALIGGKNYQLDCNEKGSQILHGGSDGTGVRLWIIKDLGEDYVTLIDHLDDNHMGLPGAMDVTLTYRITPGPCLEIEFGAIADQTTLCNFAHHSYFNLDGSPDILDHHLQIEADHYLPVDDNQIPTGAIENVANTPFDFHQSRPIAWQNNAYGYDHNFCLGNKQTDLRPIARLHSPKSGLTMTMISTEPGLQVYDGVTTASNNPGISGIPYGKYAGIAMEPQCWPDAPNQKHFPNAELSAGEKYRQLTILKFT